MAGEGKAWDGVAKTVTTIVSLIVAAVCFALTVSRASPADVKAVDTRISGVSDRMIVVETKQKGLLDVLGELKDEVKTSNDNFEEALRMMHRHPERLTN